MSENRMAASIPNSSIGWIVTSAARAGVLHISRNPPARERVARYWGR